MEDDDDDGNDGDGDEEEATSLRSEETRWWDAGIVVVGAAGCGATECVVEWEI